MHDFQRVQVGPFRFKVQTQFLILCLSLFLLKLKSFLALRSSILSAQRLLFLLNHLRRSYPQIAIEKDFPCIDPSPLSSHHISFDVLKSDSLSFCCGSLGGRPGMASSGFIPPFTQFSLVSGNQ